MTMTLFRTRSTCARHPRVAMPALARAMGTLAGLYIVSVALGFASFVLAFEVGLLQTMGMLFFRGLVLAALSGAFTLALVAAALARWPIRGLGNPRRLLGRRAFALGQHLLSRRRAGDDRPLRQRVRAGRNGGPSRPPLYTPDAMSALFTTVYVGDYAQIDRRLREQSATGNVERIGDSYRISPRGRRFIALSQRIGGAFGGDPRFASPKDAAPRARAED